jgi:hypothetical protein
MAIAASLTFVQPANAAQEADRPSEFVNNVDAPTITAPLSKLTFEKTSVSSTPAPQLMAAPVVAVQSSQPEAATTATNSAPVAKKNDVQTPAPTQKPAPVAPASSGKGAIIAAAALAQLGVNQDCTALATNALAAAGIHHHGWPASYMALGTITSNPVPGDLIYYGNGGMGMAHIAVYIGNGQAVHGGWNGGTTAIFSANVGSGPVYIHV